MKGQERERGRKTRALFKSYTLKVVQGLSLAIDKLCDLEKKRTFTGLSVSINKIGSLTASPRGFLYGLNEHIRVGQSCYN